MSEQDVTPLEHSMDPGPAAPGPQADDLGARVASDRADPDLMALPAAPQRRRLVAMTLMALALVASLGLLLSIRGDVSYFFAADRATTLGEASAVAPAELVANSYVRVSGMPMASRMVRYRRLLPGTEYAVFPLAGQRNIFVQVRADAGPQAMARREHTGRLVTFGQMGGRFAEVRSYLEETMEMPVTSESFLVLSEEPPGAYAWAPALAALCAFFALLNIALFVRWFRPLPAGQRTAAGRGADASESDR